MYMAHCLFQIPSSGCYKSSLILLLLISSELLGLLSFIYLGYIMLYILNDLCLVCLSLYAVHTLLLSLHIYQWCCKKQKNKTD